MLKKRGAWFQKHFLNWPVAATFILSGIIFGTVGWFVPSPLSPAKYLGGALYQTDDPYQYVDPLLACDIGSQESFPELAPLKNKISQVISSKEKDGTVQSVSVYYRRLKGARWFDINPTEQYAPASLLKTFVMMAYYKEADQENNSNLLQRQFVYQNSFDQTDDPGMIIPHLSLGKSYTANDLINQMIVYSDNNALSTLTSNMDADGVSALNEIFSNLKISSPLKTNDTGYTMPVDQYAMIFRVLYGATYLSRENSEKALSLLAETKYDKGIVAGLPKNVSVAHKFGVVSSAQGPQELHDCGIVYYPNHPYLLCIMTKGTDALALQNTIQAISSVVYQDTDKRLENQKT